MTLTLGFGPFAPHTPGQFNGRWEGPAHRLYWEDYLPRLRAVFGDETVLDTRAAKLLHETGHLPVHYIPREDVRFDLLEPTERQTHCPFKGDASYWSVRVGDRVADNAAWGYPQPLEEAPALQGYVALYFDAMDGWYVEDERVYAHMKDPYHRVDVHRSSQHVVVRSDGEVLAESDRPHLLFETGLPTRYYLPREDARTELFQRSDTVSQCPYKGDGQHWHLRTGAVSLEDAAWSLPSPLPAAQQAAGCFCFYPNKVTVEVDGTPLKA